MKLKRTVTFKDPDVVEMIASIPDRSTAIFLEQAVIHYSKTEAGQALLKSLQARKKEVCKRNSETPFRTESKRTMKKDGKVSFLDRLKGDLS